MADMTFNTSANVTLDRELMLAYLNTGTAQSPTWSPLGNTWGDMQKPTMTQSFDPWNITGGDPSAVKLWNLAIKDHDVAHLSAMDVLIVHKYAGTAGTAMFAERYPASAIAVTGLGGEGGGRLSMPIEITFGGERATGTASINGSGVVTFTAG